MGSFSLSQASLISDLCRDRQPARSLKQELLSGPCRRLRTLSELHLEAEEFVSQPRAEMSGNEDNARIWQEGEMPTYEPGDYVKVEFRDDKTMETEWMWMRVESADDPRRVVFGWLDNEPIVLTSNLRVGERLAVSYDNVRQHKKSAELPR